MTPASLRAAPSSSKSAPYLVATRLRSFDDMVRRMPSMYPLTQRVMPSRKSHDRGDSNVLLASRHSRSVISLGVVTPRKNRFGLVGSGSTRVRTNPLAARISLISGPGTTRPHMRTAVLSETSSSAVRMLAMVRSSPQTVCRW